MPGPYWSGPGSARGKRARVSAWQRGQCLISASVWAHDLLEDDVDEGASLVAGGCGGGEVFAAVGASLNDEFDDMGAGAGVGAARVVRLRAFALGAGAGAGGGILGALGGGEAGVGAALRGVLFHEHRHQQLEQHQQGLEQSAAVLVHLARRAQRLELSLERIEL